MLLLGSRGSHKRAVDYLGWLSGSIVVSWNACDDPLQSYNNTRIAVKFMAGFNTTAKLCCGGLLHGPGDDPAPVVLVDHHHLDVQVVVAPMELYKGGEVHTSMCCYKLLSWWATLSTTFRPIMISVHAIGLLTRGCRG